MALWKKDCTALLEGYATGDCDPVAAVQICLDRIAALDPVLNAWTARAEGVLDAARASAVRWAQGQPVGPLDGVPIIVKDNLCAAGMPAAWGNAALARRIVCHDERPVAALRAAGAIVLGKGNTPEFAVEGYTGNATFGETRNPFDPALTPGGSSGGVVAAVASGMAFAGLGTDGGGSIRRPAGYTALWGLKPGIGAVPRGGGLAQVLLDFETVGPLARSLRDVALFHQVLAGVGKGPDPGPSRILCVARLGDAPCDPAMITALDRAAARLSGAGHRVEHGSLPHDLGPLNAVWPQIGEIGLARFFDAAPEVAESAAPRYRDMAARGREATATDLYAILELVFALREAARDLWGYDAILMPASAAHPWPVGAAFPTDIDGQPVGPRGHAIYTGWVNAAGLPGLAVPAGLHGAIPVGLQLIGPAGHDAALLALARDLDAPFTWPGFGWTETPAPE